MLIAIPKEQNNENRVALIPSAVKTLKKAGLEVVIEAGAGAASFYADSDYESAGASIQASTKTLFNNADILIKVSPLKREEAEMLKKGAIVISLLDVYAQLPLVQQLAAANITSFAMELLPRITRAQSMDVLSSMAAIAGYKAVITAADLLPQYFPMLVTSAGTVKAARVFVIGAGVAGLMAISTAKRLGAVVEAYDTRPVVKEQVESVGGKFVEFDLDTADAQDKGGYAKAQSDEFYKKQQAQMAAKVTAVNVIITTAAIPGKPSPRLITDAMIQKMQPGSVIVDLAAERGGNAEGTEHGKVVVKHGVTLVGYTDYPSRTATHASQLYAKNVSNFLLNMVKDGKVNLNMEDEIISGSLVTHEGQVVNAMVKALIEKN